MCAALFPCVLAPGVAQHARPSLMSARRPQARAKIEEMHKNYYALAASTKAGIVAKVKEQIDPKTLPLSRSEMWAFTATGGFRP